MVNFEHISHLFLVFLSVTLDGHIFVGKVYLEPYQTPIMELFCENIKEVLAVTTFHKKAAS